MTENRGVVVMDIRLFENRAMSTDSLVYLNADTKIEPLACRWYAWPHLVSPVQHALNIAFRQLPILKSFISNPSVHEAASKDPKFLCAPFIQTTQRDVPAIKELLAKTASECTELTSFAEALVDLDRQLQASADGYRLDEFYQALPEPLAGLVEITYDLNNRPAIRVVEELAYNAGLENRHTQEISFFRTKDRDRDFFLNTPRLDHSDRMIFPMSFDDTRLDLLARSRIEPVSFDALADSLGIEQEQRPRFREFFTDAPATRQAPDFEADGVRIRYFGHACVLIQTSEVSILIDPVLAWERDEAEARLTFHDLPDYIDYVFLTHTHQDHFCPEVLLQLRNRIGRILVPANNSYNYADPAMKLILKRLGFNNVDVLNPLDEIKIPGGVLTAIPSYGEHADLSIASKHGTHLRLKGHTFLLLADADCLDRVLYKRLAARLGCVDYLYIGMECNGAPLSWIYGPYLPGPVKRRDDQSRRLSGSNFERAWAIVEEFGCKKGAYVYAMGQEYWLKHLMGLEYSADSIQILESNRFVERCRNAGIPSERLKGCREMVL